MEATASTKSATAEGVRPFTVDIPDEQIEDLRRRIEATRLPPKETVEDRLVRACSWRRPRSSFATGRATTTWAGSRRG